MTEETDRFLEKARSCLANARIALNAGLNNDAGRNAYLAVFHAAQAFIFRHRGKAAKTHQGVQAEFSRLAMDKPGIDRDDPVFLSQAYNLKSVADYELGPDAIIPAERVEEAIDKAGRFVGHIASLLDHDTAL